MPKHGVKFRPQSLYLSKVGGLHLNVSGVYGQSHYQNGIEVENGLSFGCQVKELMDDKKMNALATKLKAPSPESD